MSQIVFDEDRAILSKMNSNESVPKKGLEGWFHKHSPYSAKTNRMILILTALAFFIVAVFFYSVSRHNQKQVTNDRNSSFIERSNTTSSR